MLNFFWRLLAELLARPAIATRVIERAQRPPCEGTTRALAGAGDRPRSFSTTRIIGIFPA
ncbi:hypothetical protein SRABI06_00689 [Pseudomonas brassicacearum]|nr:hypothetical protein SRABI06_00689 [Pseudomonas brassicacearum]